MRLFLFSIFVSFSSFSQNIDFEGVVFDTKSETPIPYVNISFLNTLVGTSTDDNGHFIIEISENLLNNRVHISSLGYKDTIMPAEVIYKTKKLSLVEETYELDEVVVSEKLGDAIVLNSIASYDITSGFDSSSTPWVLALYFPNIGASKKYLKNATIFFRDQNEFKSGQSKFRLRFYAVDPETKKPSTDLVRKSLILESIKGNDFTSIDLDALSVEMPRDGIYVGLEWLFIPYNWYKKEDKNNLTNASMIEDRFAPTFGGVYSENQNYKVMIYGMGEWQEFNVKSKGNNKNFIPAVSLKVVKR
ncbi:carboxypeptidase-like regulatory domain-containing protein [Croceitalea sp. P059]|uniref:carboxypeptidase-like regulatory domain-containing protein n=1 Tax=Croceitalea sp. P059 TaxID=3075601 RepID=UPI002884AA3B|nr:carboxypeptidase-like regulatory domain-containing protein [Croceitalea sp. P059]MDT0540282.1 carboxypeptidase-like regulatory domain-containing protein [Croceitalea sp. P059]